MCVANILDERREIFIIQEVSRLQTVECLRQSKCMYRILLILNKYRCWSRIKRIFPWTLYSRNENNNKKKVSCIICTHVCVYFIYKIDWLEILKLLYNLQHRPMTYYITLCVLRRLISYLHLKRTENK